MATRKDIEVMNADAEQRGDSEFFEYIDENTHLHVRCKGYTRYITLLRRGEVISRSECHVTDIFAVIDDFREYARHTTTEGWEYL